MRISDWSSDVCSSDLVRPQDRGSHDRLDRPRKEAGMTPTWRSAFLKLLGVALAITAVVLTVRIAEALSEGEIRVLDAGEHATLHDRVYATNEHTVLHIGRAEGREGMGK